MIDCMLRRALNCGRDFQTVSHIHAQQVSNITNLISLVRRIFRTKKILQQNPREHIEMDHGLQMNHKDEHEHAGKSMNMKSEKQT